jgi:hypothetical protein
MCSKTVLFPLQSIIRPIRKTMLPVPEKQHYANMVNLQPDAGRRKKVEPCAPSPPELLLTYHEITKTRVRDVKVPSLSSPTATCRNITETERGGNTKAVQF